MSSWIGVGRVLLSVGGIHCLTHCFSDQPLLFSWFVPYNKKHGSCTCHTSGIAVHRLASLDVEGGPTVVAAFVSASLFLVFLLPPVGWSLWWFSALSCSTFFLVSRPELRLVVIFQVFQMLIDILPLACFLNEAIKVSSLLDALFDQIVGLNGLY